MSIVSKGAKGQTLSEIINILSDTTNNSSYIENIQQIYDIIKSDSSIKLANTILTKFEIKDNFINQTKSLDIKIDNLKKM